MGRLAWQEGNGYLELNLDPRNPYPKIKRPQIEMILSSNDHVWNIEKMVFLQLDGSMIYYI